MPTRLWTEIKSVLLATFVTALVWIYAEGESLSVRVVSVNINLPSDPTGALVIRPIDPIWRGVARVRLEGNTRTIDDATTALGLGLKLTPGAPGVPNEPGDEKTVDLREAISAIPELKGLGSSVAGVEPQYVRVNVVKLASRDLPIRVELGIEIPLDGEPIAQPAAATIRLPEPALAGLPEGCAIIATVAAEDLRRLKGDGTETVIATLRPPPLNGLGQGTPVTISPESVTVKLRIRRKVESIRVTTVPVWYSLPPTEDGSKWNVEVVDKFLTDVSFTGISDDVQRIRTGELPIKAMVELSTDDLERAITNKAVTFPGLPGSLAPTLSPPSVRLRIARQAPPPSGR